MKEPSGVEATRALRIAFTGIRGVPASYSGFETFVEEAGSRLAERGHHVTVYNRGKVGSGRASYRGMRVVTLPCVQQKHLETITHSFLATLHSLRERYDVLYVCGVGSSALLRLAAMSGAKTVVNVDGADHSREKWGRLASWYLRLAERMAVTSGSTIIADAVGIQARYRSLYGAESIFIPYGANIGRRNDCGPLLDRYGLRADRYVLFVGRLVPENRAHTLIEAFRGSDVPDDVKLVIVGDAPYSDRYKASLEAMASERVVFTGYLFGDEYQRISSGAGVFVLASGVDGTRPVLLDQMGFGNCVIVRDTLVNLEVVGEAAMTFSDQGDVGSLRAVLSTAFSNPEAVERLRVLSVQRVRERYSWESVTRQYEELFLRMVSRKPTLSGVG